MDPYERITQVDKRIAEEVKKREHLYNPFSEFYKDAAVTYSSWKEIADQLGLEHKECQKSWRVLRDRYVRVKKAWDSKGGKGKKIPSVYTYLSWLEPHIKHRTPSADAETETSEPTHETQVEITAEATLVPPHTEEDRPPPSSLLASRQRRKIKEMESRLQSHVAKLEEPHIKHRTLSADAETETSEPTHETQVEITAETTLVPPHTEEDGPPPSSLLASRQRRKIKEMESRLQSHVAKLEEPHIKHRTLSADAETETSEPTHETQVEITAETTLVPPHTEEDGPPPSSLLVSRQRRKIGEMPTHETQVEITAEATLVPHHTEEDRPPPSSLHVSRQMRKIEEMESRLQSHVAKLEERRAQLEQQKATLEAQKTADKEVDKFSLMVASLLRKIPEELRPEAMFEVHKVMYEKLQKAKQTAAQQVS